MARPLPEPEPIPEMDPLGEPLAEPMAELMANSTLTSEEAAAMAPLEDLLPTLLQIFLTIALGWLAGNLGIFGSRESRGLGIFVGKFSLPALIFISLASLNLSDIKWSFLLAVLIGKTIIFGLVLTFDFLINRNLSRASLFAIYSTQTNDFGMGLPILSSVYGPGNPMVGLLYLLAPISLLILNPIGFVLLEVGRGSEGKGKSRLATFLGVVKGLVTNPVVAMTVLGVLGNLVFSSSPPPHLTKFLKALGAAFSALAPFSLGLSMVGKLGGIRGDSIPPIISLLAVKNIISPLLTYILVGQVAVLIDGASDPSLSNFALLLGSFPTALGVASYAAEYGVAADLISAAIVLGTLASAPMMYAIANVLTALSESPEALARSDHSWIDCIISIGSVFFVLALFLSKPSWKRCPHLLTLLLLILTLVSSISGLIHSFVHSPVLSILHLTSLHASRLSTPGLALNIFLLARSSPLLSSPLLTPLLLLTGPLLSLFTLLLLLTPYSPSHFLVFGASQDQLSLVVHSLALLPTLGLLLQITRTSPRPPSAGSQVSRHTILLIALSTAMFTSIALSLGRVLLTGTVYPGAFKVLICLNSILSAGQGIVFAAVFGIDQGGFLFAPLRPLKDKIMETFGQTSDMAEAFMMAHSSSTDKEKDLNSIMVGEKVGEKAENERKLSVNGIGRSV